ncbi:hypothetical protein PANO111632_14180 [Paracoccus nototheniae]
MTGPLLRLRLRLPLSQGLVQTHFIALCGDYGMAAVTAAGMPVVIGIFDFVGTVGSGWPSAAYDNRWLLFWYCGLSQSPEPVAQLRSVCLQGCDLGPIGTHLPVPGKGSSRGDGQFPHPAAQATPSGRSRLRAACDTATRRSVTSLTASAVNSGPNFRLVMSAFQFPGHDLIFVSTKLAADQRASSWHSSAEDKQSNQGAHPLSTQNFQRESTGVEDHDVAANTSILSPDSIVFKAQ